jgi:nucleoside-diphosphate-sugar epimerase
MATPRLEGKVLITGASGFIGGRLRSMLLSAGVDLVALRRPGSPSSELGRSVEAKYSDVAALARIVSEERPDYILHAAGVTKGSSYADFESGNVMPTRHLIRAVRQEHPGVKRFVLVSSLAAYGPSASTVPQRESNPPRPIEHYGQSKLEAERVVEDESGEVPWTIVRPCAVYGPGDVDHFPLFQSAVFGFTIFYGNRDHRASWIYVDECVQGILDAAGHPNTRAKGYFLANEQILSWGDFQATLAEVIGKPVRELNFPEPLLWAGAFAGEIASRIDNKPRLLNLQKARLGVQQAWTCSSEAARRDFGFRTSVDLTEGIRRTHAWYQDNHWYRSLDPRELLSTRSLRRLVGHLRRAR